MNQVDPQVSEASSAGQNRAARTRLRQIERRQWWLWASAALITLLLTLGVASFAFPLLHAQGDFFYLLDLRQAVYGLLGVVLLFEVYVVYQQLQIQRIHLQLSSTSFSGSSGRMQPT